MKGQVYFTFNGTKIGDSQSIPLPPIDLDKLRETVGSDEAPTEYTLFVNNDTKHRLIEIGINTNLPDGTYQILDIPKSIPVKGSRPFKLAVYGKKLFESDDVPDDIRLGVAYREVMERI